MNIPKDSQPEPVILIIADISGYTRYMTANAKTLAHSQTIITELVHAIVGQIQLPLEVAKLEGDAVFLVCRKKNDAHPWPEAKRIISDNLLNFFHCFSLKLNELVRSTTCTCSACTFIEKLQLKIVIHSGEALFHRVLNFVELAGVDVIIVHRLLKNSVAASQYLLLTEAAHRDLEFTQPVNFTNHREIYEDIGLVKALVYLPGGGSLAVTAAPAEYTSYGQRFGTSWRLFTKLWFAPFATRPKQLAFNHVVSDAGTGGRAAFALLTFVLTPIFLPVGTVFVMFHALRQPNDRTHREHIHKPDGSCCEDHPK